MNYMTEEFIQALSNFGDKAIWGLGIAVVAILGYNFIKLILLGRRLNRS